MSNPKVPTAAEGMPNFDRRAFLRSTAGAAALGGVAIMAAPSAAALTFHSTETDPTFAAIERQRATYAALNELEADDPAWEEANAADWTAWDDVCEIVPTTLAGAAALASYVERQANRAGLSMDLGVSVALVTIATAVAKFAYLEERAAR